MPLVKYRLRFGACVTEHATLEEALAAVRAVYPAAAWRTDGDLTRAWRDETEIEGEPVAMIERIEI